MPASQLFPNGSTRSFGAREEDVLQERLRVLGRAVLPERGVGRGVVELAPHREAAVLAEVGVEVAEDHRDLRLGRPLVARVRLDPFVEPLHDVAVVLRDVAVVFLPGALLLRLSGLVGGVLPGLLALGAGLEDDDRGAEDVLLEESGEAGVVLLRRAVRDAARLPLVGVPGAPVLGAPLAGGAARLGRRVRDVLRADGPLLVADEVDAARELVARERRAAGREHPREPRDPAEAGVAAVAVHEVVLRAPQVHVHRHRALGAALVHEARVLAAVVAEVAALVGLREFVLQALAVARVDAHRPELAVLDGLGPVFADVLRHVFGKRLRRAVPAHVEVAEVVLEDVPHEIRGAAVAALADEDELVWSRLYDDLLGTRHLDGLDGAVAPLVDEL